MDPDTSVARQAFVLLSRVDDEKNRKQILDQVNAIPAETRTAAARMFLSTNGSLDLLVAGLADSEKDVRQCAYYHALKVSLGHTSFVTRLRTTLQAVPEANRTSEINEYLSLENPEAWDDDD